VIAHAIEITIFTAANTTIAVCSDAVDVPANACPIHAVSGWCSAERSASSAYSSDRNVTMQASTPRMVSST
jgi:hypothetical protein